MPKCKMISKFPIFEFSERKFVKKHEWNGINSVGVDNQALYQSINESWTRISITLFHIQSSPFDEIETFLDVCV